MSKSFLLYLTYNNYYNRIFKREETIKDYDYYAVNREEAVNFNPGDGVNTTHIMRITADEEAENNMPDYMVELKEDKYGDFFVNSRWFIIDATRTCAGQYQMELRRDVIADKWDQIKNAPIFVEKAILNENDPMIFNSENMGFNQIKKHEILLTDNTKSPWIVGYIDRTATGTVNIAGITPSIEVPTKETYSSRLLKMPDKINFINFVQGWYRYGNKDLDYINNGRFGYGFTQDGTPDFLEKDKPTGTFYQIDNGTIYGNTDYYRGTGRGLYYLQINQSSRYLSFNDVISEFNPASLKSNFKDDFGCVSNDEWKKYEDLDGVIVRTTTDGKIYQLKFTKVTEPNYEHWINESNSKLWENFNSTWTRLKEKHPGVLQKNMDPVEEYSFLVNFERTYGYLEWVDITEEANSTLTINGNHKHLEDAPYDMFCIPYFNGVEIYDENNVLLSKSEQNFNFRLINSMIVDLGEKLYDVQLLPYCPCQNLIEKRNGKYVLKTKEAEEYDKIVKNDKTIGCILWANKASGSFSINESILYTNKKITNETKSYRLTSPNYASSFDFSVAKNDGVNFWNVDFTYLPFQPYIHICPDFKGLYGRDFDDTRGLILNGDFSLAMMSSDWVTYQIENKNYQNIFNRQIESMEFNNKFSQTNDIIGAIAGSFSGSSAGFSTGMTGGPWGAAIGASIGGTASLATGIADVVRNQKARKEALDLTQDQFGYELGNIKARPNNLTKTTGYTANNKYFPFVEVYEATEQEVRALINKIKYNGMTVMRIGQITEFLGNTFKDSKENYFKGKLIRLQLTDEEFHFVNTIANELYQGIYIPIEVR